MRKKIKLARIVRLMFCLLVVFFLSFSITGGAEVKPTQMSWSWCYRSSNPPPPTSPPDTTPPETTITSYPENPTTSVNAVFVFSSNEAGSSFYCQLDSGGFSFCSSPHVYSGLTESSHTFEVEAADPAGNNDPSPALYAWDIISVPSPPSPPSDLNATAVSSTQIDLSWTDSSDDEDGFIVERKFKYETDWASVGSLGADVTSHSDTGLASGSTYFYRCNAYNPIGNSAYSNEASATTVSLDNWQQISNVNKPFGLSYDGITAVWTGTEMIVWGGCWIECGDCESGCPCTGNGGRYDPSSDTWYSVTNPGFFYRGYHSAAWTGTEMIIWGGGYGENGFPTMTWFNNGSRYNPDTDSWINISTTNAPEKRGFASTIWTGTEMIVWGGAQVGFFGTLFGDGGRYSPADDSWSDVNLTGDPSGRIFHTAIWTGGEMIIWGGLDPDQIYPSISGTALNDGARYTPDDDSWTGMSTTDAPSKRYGHTAVWTGTEMIIWGGTDHFGEYFNNGGRYNPASNSWSAVSQSGAPDPRAFHSVVWTGTEMIVWGGESGMQVFNTGGRYNPATNTWTPMTTTEPPTSRRRHNVVWTGNIMIIWGGVCASNGWAYTP